jgi:hypothetical protein
MGTPHHPNHIHYLPIHIPTIKDIHLHPPQALMEDHHLLAMARLLLLLLMVHHLLLLRMGGMIEVLLVRLLDTMLVVGVR